VGGGRPFFLFLFERTRPKGPRTPFCSPQNSYDCGEVANGFGVVTTKIWSKNNNLLSCKFLQNTHTYVCVYVCMYVEKKKFIIKLQILQTHICMCVCMYVCMYYVRIKVREEFIIYMLDNGARAFSIHPKKSKNRLYIHPSLHGNAERTELSITWVHPSRVCALESFRVVCWDDFGVKGFSFLFF
jgi:hypothetical protein